MWLWLQPPAGSNMCLAWSRVTRVALEAAGGSWWKRLVVQNHPLHRPGPAGAKPELTEKTMHSYLSTFLLFVFLVVPKAVAAKPFDGAAAELLCEVEKAVGEKKGPLEKPLAEELLAAAQTDSHGFRMVAAYGLAYVSDESASEALNKLASDVAPRVKGVACWAIRIRGLAGQTGLARMGQLAYAMARTPNSMEKIMLVQTLASDFGKDSHEVLLLALRDEKDPMVRLVLADRLSQSTQDTVLRDALQALEKDSYYELHEDLLFFLDQISGAGNRRLPFSMDVIKEEMRRKLRLHEQ